MSKKIKILFQPSDLAGVGHFRSIWPAQEIQKKYKDDFDVKINVRPNFNDIEQFKKYDIIHFHRGFGPHDRLDEIFDTLKEAGVTMVMDLDDYWSPPQSHPMYQAAKNEGISEKIIAVMKKADYVTTTTEIFADEIRKFNKNVIVIPNAIDTNHKMWKQDESVKKGDKLRISWIGGSSHLKDLELLKTSMTKLNNDKSLEDLYQIILCGFDIRGHITEVNPQTKQQRTRKILPHETVWNRFESIFTTDYKIVDEDYKKFLHSYKNEEYKGKSYDELNYVRRWTLPLTQYGKHYNYCDVCLAPLVKNTFNKVKSELKIIEAGMTKKVLIAQDFGIYKELLENGENGFLVNDARNHKDWYRNIKYLIENPKEVERISENLHNFVKDRYSLENVTKNRVEKYKELYKQNKLVATK
jgi:glycosyltransferase involved in cell wall biosynthesis